MPSKEGLPSDPLIGFHLTYDMVANEIFEANAVIGCWAKCHGITLKREPGELC
jgi:hypothetical protein